MTVFPFYSVVIHRVHTINSVARFRDSTLSFSVSKWIILKSTMNTVGAFAQSFIRLRWSIVVDRCPLCIHRHFHFQVLIRSDMRCDPFLIRFIPLDFTVVLRRNRVVCRPFYTAYLEARGSQQQCCCRIKSMIPFISLSRLIQAEVAEAHENIKRFLSQIESRRRFQSQFLS